MTIEKKILPQYFDAVVTGAKTFELRLDEDNVQTGDTLLLREWHRGKYTGRSVSRKVGFVLRGEIYGLRENWCIISLRDPSELQRIKRGTWLTYSDPITKLNAMCSNCNCATVMRFDFCPWCGADMRSDEERTAENG